MIAITRKWHRLNTRSTITNNRPTCDVKFSAAAATRWWRRKDDNTVWPEDKIQPLSTDVQRDGVRSPMDLRQTVTAVWCILLDIVYHSPHSLRFIRPPNIVVGGFRFYRNFSFFLSPFFRPLSSELAERNSTKIGHRVGTLKWVRFENACPKSGYPLLLQIGGSKPPFSTTSQLNGNFNGLYLRNETWYT